MYCDKPDIVELLQRRSHWEIDTREHCELWRTGSVWQWSEELERWFALADAVTIRPMQPLSEIAAQYGKSAVAVAYR